MAESQEFHNCNTHWNAETTKNIAIPKGNTIFLYETIYSTVKQDFTNKVRFS